MFQYDEYAENSKKSKCAKCSLMKDKSTCAHNASWMTYQQSHPLHIILSLPLATMLQLDTCCTKYQYIENLSLYLSQRSSLLNYQITDLYRCNMIGSHIHTPTSDLSILLNGTTTTTTPLTTPLTLQTVFQSLRQYHTVQPHTSF